MKRILLFALILCTNSLFAQPDGSGLDIPMKNGKVVYEAAVSIPGRSKSAIYADAALWLDRYFYNSNKVLQHADKQAGLIEANGTAIVPFKGVIGNTVPYKDKLSVKIECRDNAYHITVYDQTLTSPENHIETITTTPETLVGKLDNTCACPFNNDQAKRMLQGVNLTMNGMFESLKKTVETEESSL
jgi:uncharacterized protein with TBP-like fold DUF4468